MAITKSAKKSYRQSLRRKSGNLGYKSRLKDSLKEFLELIAKKKIKEAQSLLPQVFQVLDKCAKVGIIKKGNADRKKSRLAKLLQKSSR
jgi:small subunit ribosomal protein S20